MVIVPIYHASYNFLLLSLSLSLSLSLIDRDDDISLPYLTGVFPTPS